MIRTCTFVLILAFVLMARSQDKSLVSPFPSTDSIENVLDGCACRLTPSNCSEKYLLISTADGRTAWLNIAGQVLRFQLTSTNESRMKHSAFFREYKSIDLTVHAQFKRLHSAQEEGEESDRSRFETTITVSRGSQKQTLRAQELRAC